MSLPSVDDASFADEVLGAEGAVLVEFWAERCLPCVMLAATLETVADSLGPGVRIVRLNVDENPEVARAYGVTGLPMMKIFRGGEVRATQAGSLPKSRLVGWIKGSV